MIFIPSKNETLVLPFDHPTVLHKLMKNIDSVGDQRLMVFNGWIKTNTFKITQKIKRPDNFIPVVDGLIESSTKGSIIFLRYRLLFSTKMFLIFWSVLLLLLAIFFGVEKDSYYYAAIALLVGVVNYLIVYMNFKKKVKTTHELLLKVLE